MKFIRYFTKPKIHFTGLNIVTVFLCFFSYSTFSLAENDSLHNAYLNDLIKLYQSGKTDSTQLILEQSDPRIKEDIFQKTGENIYYQIASMAYDSGYFEQARHWFKRSLVEEKSDGTPDQSSNYQGIALCFLKRGYTDSAGYYLEQAKQNWDSLHPTKIKTALENNLGQLYLDIGDYDNAIEHFLTALKNAQIEKDTAHLIFINTNLGTLYYQLDKYDDALAFYLKSLKLSKESHYLEGVAFSYSIGMIYAARGEYEKALQYYRGAIPACLQLAKYNDLGNIYNNTSNIFMLQNKYGEAATILKKSIKMCKLNGNQRQLGIAYANLGKTFELMHQMDSAIIYLNKAKEVFTELGTLKLQSLVLQMISYTLEKKHDYKKSLSYFQQYKELSDSLINEKVEKQIAELRTKYESEKNERENTILKKDIELEKKKNHYLAIIVSILVLLGIISIILFYFIRKNAFTKKRLAESEALRLESQLDTQKRELTLGALSVSRNLQFVNSIIQELKELSDHVDEKGIIALGRLVKKLSKQQSDSSWKEFEKRFSEVYSDFYKQLLNDFPDLTANELKLASFLKLGMNTKEICSMTFQSVRAIEAARLRLRKKLNLSGEDNLNTFLQHY